MRGLGARRRGRWWRGRSSRRCRLALWQRALLAYAPNGDALLDELDWGYLAQRLNMTGAGIKGTALGAAFMARAEGTRIGMRHLLAAAQRETAKQGVRQRVPLQEASR